MDQSKDQNKEVCKDQNKEHDMDYHTLVASMDQHKEHNRDTRHNNMLHCKHTSYRGSCMTDKMTCDCIQAPLTKNETRFETVKTRHQSRPTASASILDPAQKYIGQNKTFQLYKTDEKQQTDYLAERMNESNFPASTAMTQLHAIFQ